MPWYFAVVNTVASTLNADRTKGRDAMVGFRWKRTSGNIPSEVLLLTRKNGHRGSPMRTHKHRNSRNHKKGIFVSVSLFQNVFRRDAV